MSLRAISDNNHHHRHHITYWQTPYPILHHGTTKIISRPLNLITLLFVVLFISFDLSYIRSSSGEIQNQSIVFIAFHFIFFHL